MAGAMSLEDFLQSPCARIMDDMDEANETGITLGDLRSSEATVYDFWTTRCTNCPDALERLDSISRERGSIKFVGVNIDDIVKARQLLQEATSAGRWTRLTHVHLGEEAKEQVKEVLHMRTVPFYVVVGKEGNVLGHGNAKTLPLKTAEALDAVLVGKRAEEKQDLRNPGRDDAGASAGEGKKIDQGDDAKTPPSDADPVRAGGSMCEGGVCRLPRRPKVNSESTPKTRAPDFEPGSKPARVSRGETSEDDICELKRVEIRGDKPVSSGPPRASVECDGNVCRLVRKTSAKVTEGRDDAAAASDSSQSASGTREDEASLGVGDRLPTLQVVEIGGAEVPAARPLDQVMAGRPAVLDFWTTRCVRCPAALDRLESLAKTSATNGELSDDEPNGKRRYTYISVNLDNLQEARTMLADGRWPSIAHVFAGRDEDAPRLEVFKRRIGLKSVPFYVVIDADGRIEQVGGPTAVDLSKTATPSRSPCPAQGPDGRVVEEGSGSRSVPPRSPEPSKPSFVFTLDEDF